MASLPPSTWAITPHPSFPSFNFPPKRYRFLKPVPASSGEGAPPADGPGSADPVKLAFAKAASYRKSKTSPSPPNPNPNPNPVSSAGGGNSGGSEAPDPVKLAMAKAREYRKNKGAVVAPATEPRNTGQEKINTESSREKLEENKVSKKEALKVSTTDFLGLEFAEKKSYRGMPPGLVPFIDSIPEGDFPNVEIIVGDTSKFKVTTPSKTTTNEDNGNDDLYKPKVSTWGVFPRPNNISKTFGGGKVIQPGEVLETAEDKAAKEKRSRELIATYKKKMGMNIDPKTKAECKKALEEGDELMDCGKLQEALPLFEKVMNDVVFQSELYGLAALQWSICQDSLRRTKEARVMYEKLQSHPNVQVRKKAKQFVYSFQAMEMLKVKTSSYSPKTGYENYFEAFVENKVEYSQKKEEENEDALRQGLPYIMFLISPIVVVLLIALRKSLRF